MGSTRDVRAPLTLTAQAQKGLRLAEWNSFIKPISDISAAVVDLFLSSITTAIWSQTLGNVIIFLRMILRDNLGLYKGSELCSTELQLVPFLARPCAIAAQRLVVCHRQNITAPAERDDHLAWPANSECLS